MLVSFIYLAQSCKSKNDNEKVYLEYTHFDSSYSNNSSKKFDTIVFKNFSTIYFIYNNTNDLVKIKARLDSIRYGHFFEFEDQGELKNYYYLVGDDLHNSSEIKSDQGLKRYVEKGSPFVDYMKNSADSGIKKYSLIFSTFPRKNLQVSYSLNGKDYQPVELHKSRIMPLLKEADIAVDENSKKLFFKITASELFLELTEIKDSRMFYDTLIVR